MSSKEVIVSISLGGQDIRIGKLWLHVRGHKESASFEYDKEWLDHPEKFALEPALKLTEGTFHTGQGMSLFGAIGDSAPDRWGRVLMRRGEASKAKEQNRSPRTLFEIDYLLGVNDEARQGALRFSVSPDENVFLSPKTKTSILTTSIDFYDNAASLETAIRVAREFRLNKEEALSILKEVASAMKQWREVASEFGLSKRECDRMSSAFAG